MNSHLPVRACSPSALSMRNEYSRADKARRSARFSLHFRSVSTGNHILDGIEFYRAARASPTGGKTNNKRNDGTQSRTRLYYHSRRDLFKCRQGGPRSLEEDLLFFAKSAPGIKRKES